MSNKTFLFDLDGTLLGMDQDKFLALYFGSLKEYLMNLKHDPQVFFYHLNKGIKAMLTNNGSMTNEKAFLEATKPYPNLIDIMIDYYNKDFSKTKSSCYLNQASVEVIKYLKEKNYQIVLATNPIFPLFVTKMRIKWAGLDASDFSYITSYENSSYTKPHKAYFLEILKKLNLEQENVIYVGNDVDDDFKEIGNDTFTSFIISDCLINKENKPITIPCLSMQNFLNYLKENA